VVVVKLVTVHFVMLPPLRQLLLGDGKKKVEELPLSVYVCGCGFSAVKI
jgi:hypothetical protein